MRIVYKNNEDGLSIMSGSPQYLAALEGTDHEKMIQLASKDLPEGTPYSVVEDDSLPPWRGLRGAWGWDTDQEGVTVNLEKSKTITHEKRRRARDELFKPLDRKATIPAEAQEAEAERVLIREAYSVYQENIDSAADVQELEVVIKGVGWE